jgi:hypothetical protein
VAVAIAGTGSPSARPEGGCGQRDAVPHGDGDVFDADAGGQEVCTR